MHLPVVSRHASSLCIRLRAMRSWVCPQPRVGDIIRSHSAPMGPKGTRWARKCPSTLNSYCQVDPPHCREYREVGMGHRCFVDRGFRLRYVTDTSNVDPVAASINYQESQTLCPPSAQFSLMGVSSWPGQNAEWPHEGLDRDTEHKREMYRPMECSTC